MRQTKKVTKRDRVRDKIKMGTHTKKEIARQLGMSVESVAVHMTHLRWLGHFIVYDVDSKVLKMTTKEEYTRWVPKRKVPPTTEDQILKLHQKRQRFVKAQRKWQQKNDIPLQMRDVAAETAAQLTLHRIYIERIDTELDELERQLSGKKRNPNQEDSVNVLARKNRSILTN